MNITDPAADRREIKPLTALRGVAAMAVVLQHFSATAQLHCSGWIPSLVPHGYMAVDFFFVLSGFIMSYTYLAGFERLGMQAYLPFLWKRVARIFPLGIAVTAIILVAGAVTAHWGKPGIFISGVATSEGLGTAVVVNLLFLQGFFTRYSLNDPSWSISVELAAYVVFPALIWLLFKASRPVSLAFCAVGAAILFQFARMGPVYGLGTQGMPFDLIRCVVEFGFGMVAYRIFGSSSRLRSIGRDGWTWVITALSAACFVLRADLLAAFSFPFVVLAYALNRGGPSRVFSSQIPYFLGTISFSIYLVHHMFRLPELMLVQYLHPAKLSPPGALLFALLGSLSILPFATLAYYGIERPGRTGLNSMVRKLRRGRMGAAVVREPLR